METGWRKDYTSLVYQESGKASTRTLDTPYVLDLEVKETKSRLINKYLRHKRNLDRRRKRYQKQAKKADSDLDSKDSKQQATNLDNHRQKRKGKPLVTPIE